MSRNGTHVDNGPRYFASLAGNGFRLALSREGRLRSAWRDRTSFAMRVGAHRGAHQAHQYATILYPKLEKPSDPIFGGHRSSSGDLDGAKWDWCERLLGVEDRDFRLDFRCRPKVQMSGFLQSRNVRFLPFQWLTAEPVGTHSFRSAAVFRRVADGLP